MFFFRIDRRLNSYCSVYVFLLPFLYCVGTIVESSFVDGGTRDNGGGVGFLRLEGIDS